MPTYDSDAVAYLMRVTSHFNKARSLEDFTVHLPPELCCIIFEWLAAKDLQSCSLVSKSWNSWVDDERLWNALISAQVNTSAEETKTRLSKCNTVKDLKRFYFTETKPLVTKKKKSKKKKPKKIVDYCSCEEFYDSDERYSDGETVWPRYVCSKHGGY